MWIMDVRMAEWSKALRSGRSPLLWAWVQIPLLTITFLSAIIEICHFSWRRDLYNPSFGVCIHNYNHLTKIPITLH